MRHTSFDQWVFEHSPEYVRQQRERLESVQEFAVHQRQQRILQLRRDHEVRCLASKERSTRKEKGSGLAGMPWPPSEIRCGRVRLEADARLLASFLDAGDERGTVRTSRGNRGGDEAPASAKMSEMSEFLASISGKTCIELTGVVARVRVTRVSR